MAEKFDDVLREAMRHYAEHGFNDAEVLAQWMARLEAAMRAEMVPEWRMEERLREALGSIYKREVDKGAALKRHPGVQRYVLEQVKPELRNELTRRIAANAALIKLNRKQEVDATLRRFMGWASSVPAGGSNVVDVREERKKIRKGFASLSFRERRVLIDQGHKLQSAVSSIVAQGGGAIAAVWHSHYHQANYDYRVDHKDREIESKTKPYLVRGSWAMERGYIDKAGATYTDEIEQPGEFVFCRCSYRYLYNLRNLPASMLTAKGREALAEAKRKLAA